MEEGGLIYDACQAALRECVTSLPGVCEESIRSLPFGETIGPFVGLLNVFVEPLVQICGGALLF
jgi:hypothetical protein